MYDNLPPELRPLSPWAYFGYEILYAIPLIGWIFLVCHALAAQNVNKRNFARSFFVIYVLIAFLWIFAACSGLFTFGALMRA